MRPRCITPDEKPHIVRFFSVANMQPELNLHTPSMMCFTANLEHHGGDIVNMPSGRVFTFAS